MNSSFPFSTELLYWQIRRGLEKCLLNLNLIYTIKLNRHSECLLFPYCISKKIPFSEVVMLILCAPVA